MISSTTERTTATGSDSTNSYAYGYRIFAQSDLLVTVKNLTTLVETTLALTTDYTVNAVGQANGTIVLVNSSQAWLDGSGFLSASYLIVIRRVRPLTQSVSIRNQSTFYAATHEDEFDNLIMIAQQFWDEISRSVRLPETITFSAFNTKLPTNIANSAGQALVVNTAGNGWAMSSSGISWQALDIPFTSFQASALTSQIAAFVLPANCILMGVAIKHWTAFSGSAITDVYMDLGISGKENLFISDFDVHAAVGDTVFANALVQYIGSFANPTNITIQANSTGANLSALSAGSVRVHYWYMNVGV